MPIRFPPKLRFDETGFKGLAGFTGFAPAKSCNPANPLNPVPNTTSLGVNPAKPREGCKPFYAACSVASKQPRARSASRSCCSILFGFGASSGEIVSADSFCGITCEYAKNPADMPRIISPNRFSLPAKTDSAPVGTHHSHSPICRHHQPPRKPPLRVNRMLGD